MAPALCKECGCRPKMTGRHRCIICHTRHLPIGDQVAAARKRLAMVPEGLRKRTVKPAHWPEGQRWCGGCQSFVDLVDVPKGLSRCRACSSATQHAAMIEKTYGLTAAEYDALLAAQGQRCAICRNRPKSKRLAVDHDHQTGAVRGLLCSRCNHDLMGSAWDSKAMALALWHYINTPPTSGHWIAPELGLVAPEVSTPVSNPVDDFVTVGGKTPEPEATGRQAILAKYGSSGPSLDVTRGLPTAELARNLTVDELVALVNYLKAQGYLDPAPF